MRFSPFRNMMLKLSALALAVLLWVHVATNKSYEHQLDLPLRLVNLPEGLVLVSELPSTVSVKVRATGKELLVLSAGNHAVTVSASDCRVGTVEKHITNSEVAALFGRSVESVEVLSPRSVLLRFERELQKRLPIHSAVRAEAADGFVLVSEPRIEPQTVLVSGPVSVLQQLKHVETAPVQFESLTASVNQTANLLLPDSLHLSVADSHVTVMITVEPRRQKTFANVAIAPPDNFAESEYDIIPSHLMLTLGIPQSRLESVSASDITVTFRRLRLTRDTVKAELRYLLPKDVTIIGAHPDSVLIVRKP